MKRYLIPMMLLAVILAQFVPAAGFAARPAAAASYCDWAQFVADVTIPDGTSFAPGAAFTKTWRLKNIGTCAWNTSYALVYASGEKMGTTTVVNLPSSVAPGATIDLTVNMTAPTTRDITAAIGSCATRPTYSLESAQRPTVPSGWIST
jgi:hypothetical protein